MGRSSIGSGSLGARQPSARPGVPGAGPDRGWCGGRLLLRLGVDLGTEQDGDGAQPQPRQQDDGEALDRAKALVEGPDVTPFALNALLRQLIQVWQLDVQTPRGRTCCPSCEQVSCNAPAVMSCSTGTS